MTARLARDSQHALDGGLQGLIGHQGLGFQIVQLGIAEDLPPISLGDFVVRRRVLPSRGRRLFERRRSRDGGSLIIGADRCSRRAGASPRRTAQRDGSDEQGCTSSFRRIGMFSGPRLAQPQAWAARLRSVGRKSPRHRRANPADSRSRNRPDRAPRSLRGCCRGHDRW